MWVFAVLVALTGLWAPAASAATSVGAETRVRAIDHPTPALVEAASTETPAGVGVSGVRLRQLVSATGVVTNTADDFVDLASPARRTHILVCGCSRLVYDPFHLADRRENGRDHESRAMDGGRRALGAGDRRRM